MGIKEMVSALFATGVDIEDDSNEKFTAEQQKALDSIEGKKESVESPISETEQSRKRLRKKYEAPNIKVMDGNSPENLEKLEKMTDILKGKKVAEKEIGE